MAIGNPNAEMQDSRALCVSSHSMIFALSLERFFCVDLGGLALKAIGIMEEARVSTRRRRIMLKNFIVAATYSSVRFISFINRGSTFVTMANASVNASEVVASV
jgi:hypothetical protein